MILYRNIGKVIRFSVVFTLVMLLLFPFQAFAGRKPLPKLSRSPYLAAIALDADTGQVFFEENADTGAWPASVLKLMTLAVVLDAIERKEISLGDMVQVTGEAARMGGSQVYLDAREQFSVEDLLYALMVQSANDAAVALAIHVAGSKEAFVARMNSKAEQLAMRNSHFFSVHGLPPAEGQEVDVTTARDLALLCRELAGNPQVFAFTSVVSRDFRDGQFVMRTHNHLLENVAGCDGLKTGFFSAAGFSIAATARRDGRRVIAIVLGSEDRKVRDAKARQLIEQGFAAMSSLPDLQKKPEKQEEKRYKPEISSSEELPRQEAASTIEGWKLFVAGFFCGIVVGLAFVFFSGRRRKHSHFQ